MVATAISNLLYTEEDDIAKVFKTLFKCSFMEVVNRYEADHFTKEEVSRFKKKILQRGII